MTARAFLTSHPPANSHAERRARVRHIPIDEIVVLQASQKYVEAIDRNGTAYILDDGKENTIKALLAEYSELFVEIKRGYIVRRSEVRSIRVNLSSTSELVLKCDVRVPVSRRNIASIRKLVREYKQSIEDRMSAAHEPIY